MANAGSYDRVLTADIDALPCASRPEARRGGRARRVRIGVRLWVKHDEIVAWLQR